jgi:TPR repeat protein
MSPKHVKIVLSVGALILFVLLFIAPKVVSSEKANNLNEMANKPAAVNLNATIQLYLDMASKALDPALKTQNDSYIKLASQQTTYFDSLAKFWDKAKRPDIASLYLEQKQKKQMIGLLPVTVIITAYSLLKMKLKDQFCSKAPSAHLKTDYKLNQIILIRRS